MTPEAIEAARQEGLDALKAKIEMLFLKIKNEKLSPAQIKQRNDILEQRAEILFTMGETDNRIRADFIDRWGTVIKKNEPEPKPDPFPRNSIFEYKFDPAAAATTRNRPRVTQAIMALAAFSLVTIFPRGDEHPLPGHNQSAQMAQTGFDGPIYPGLNISLLNTCNDVPIALNTLQLLSIKGAKTYMCENRAAAEIEPDLHNKHIFECKSERLKQRAPEVAIYRCGD